MEEMIHHVKAVERGVENALLIADMPFLSFQITEEAALANAGRLVQEGGAKGVKLEGGGRSARVVERLVGAGIPALGHIGLEPQRVHVYGGYGVQGKDAAGARALLDGARALEQAGAFAVVLELVPRELARMITQRLSIPTIGIGSGPDCDGQILVLHDALGIGKPPRHAKDFGGVGAKIEESVRRYAEEVVSGGFPGAEHCTSMPVETLREIQADGGKKKT
jgi:3-methyl-2-oxobutanoate hydroxymethyltransferase